MQNKNFLWICFFAIFLSACASTKMPPQNAIVEPQKEAVVSEIIEVENPEKKDENILQISAEQAKPELPNSKEDVVLAEEFFDPYLKFPEMVERVFVRADSLYKNGASDEALKLIERFSIIKPLWKEWFLKADSLKKEFGKSEAERIKEFEPLILKIQNMNSVKSDFQMVDIYADSLLLLNPGDSLAVWAKGQKQIAFVNTQNKAKNEFQLVVQEAEVKGDFDNAIKKMQILKMRYQAFADSLNFDEMIENFEIQKATLNEADVLYWKSHSAKEALLKLDTLIAKNEFLEAKKLAQKLSVSEERIKAVEKLEAIAENFCNQKRKKTSQLFEQSQRTQSPEKKKEMLENAIENLNQCMENFPQYKKIETVKENKSFLMRELER